MKFVHMKVVWIFVFIDTHEYDSPGAAAVAGHTQFGGVHGEGGQVLVDNTYTALAFHWKSQDHALKRTMPQ
jgi:hypothetical protein